MAQIFPIDFEEKLTMAQDDYILFSDSEDGNKIKKAQYKNLKGEKGDTGTAATISVGTTTTGAAGTSASVTNVGTSSAAVFNFTIPKGDKGDTGQTGPAIVSAEFNGDDIDFTEEDGNVVTLSNAKTDLKGDKGDTGLAATVSVGTTTTLDAGEDATVTNSGTSSAAVFNFGIPKGDTGDTGPTGNGIASVTSSKAGKTTTVTITETNGDSSSFTVEDGEDGQGAGDVLGPASSTDEDVVVFDGATGKIIKDSGVKLSSKLDASALSNNNYGGAWKDDSTHTPTKGALYTKIHTMDVEIGNKAADNTVVKLSGNQTIAGTKTFSTSPVVPSKTTDATNTGTAIATEAQVYTVASGLSTLDTNVVKISGNQSIGGTKTFTAEPVLPSKSTAAGNNATKPATEAQVYNVAQSIPTVPTNVSAFNNDSGYLTASTGVTTVNGSHGAVTVNGFNPGGTATTGYVVTKTASGYEWAAPSGGIEVDSASPIQLTKIWAGSQSDYDNLSSYDSTTVYLTI